MATSGSGGSTSKDGGAGPWRVRAKKLKDVGSYDELLELANARLAKSPDEPLASAYLGYALAGKGEKEPALAALAKGAAEPKEMAPVLLLRTRLLQDLGKSSDAATALEEAFRVSSGDMNVVVVLVKAYLMLDEPADALRLAHHLISTWPENVASWRALLETAMSVGNYPEAVEAAGKVLAMDPDDSVVARYQALSLSKLGYTKDAIVALQGHLDSHPTDRDGWHDLGILLVQDGQNDEALKCFYKAKDLDHSNALTLLSIGTLLLKMNRDKEALDALFESANADPTSPDAHFNLGHAYERTGKHPEALDEYAAALMVNDGYLPGYLARGTLLAKLGRFREAQIQLEAGADKDPHMVSLLYNLACVYSSLGDHYRAYMTLKRLNHHEPFDNEAWVMRGKELAASLNVDDQSVLSWISRGEELYAMGSYVEAHECFRRALDLDPTNAVAKPRRAQTLAAVYNIPPDDGAAWYRVARMLVELRLLSDAMDAVSLLFAVRPHDPDGRVLVGRVLESLERHQPALGQADIALKQDPKHTGALALKGESLLRLSRFEEALAAWDELLKLTPDDPTVLTFRGITLCRLKRGKEGIDAFDAAIALDPRNREAWYQKGLELEAEGRYDRALEAFSRGYQ